MPRRSVDDMLSAIRPAAEWVDAILADAKLGEGLRQDLHVCLEEALANLIMHGRPLQGGKDIVIAIEAKRDSATLTVSDACAPFDVTDNALFDTSLAPDNQRVGGHGLRLLRTLATDLAYRTTENGNELRMRFSASDPLPEGADLQIIRHIAAFANTPDNALSDLLRKAARVSFAPGERMLAQGEASDCALILLTGEAEILHQSQHGDAPVAQIAAPALVGEIGALAQLGRTASVRAHTPIIALKIERRDLLAAGRHFPDLLVSVIGQLGQQIRSINNALGLYAAGLSALERDDFDPSILTDLNNPTGDLQNFSAAFQRLARRVSTERRARAEMASAALIQRAMLPPPLDAAALRGRCDTFGDMKPARKVGGDFFDLTLLDNDRLALVIGDVSGKGVPASLFMCATVTALRLSARNESKLNALVEQTNDALCAQNAESMFATLFYGVLHLGSGQLDYVNCGHNPPLLLDRNGSCRELTGHGPPLGFFPGHHWTTQSVNLSAGDGVFLFSDGVTECFSPHGEEYGDARLVETVRANHGCTATELVETVISEAERFAAGAEQSDDITCLAARLPRV